MTTLVNKYGNWVTGDEFFDRINETALFSSLIEEGNHILLVAPRRVGKTSLVREIFRRFRNEGKIDTLFVDVQGCATPEDLIVQLAVEARDYSSIWNKIGERLKSLFGNIESVGASDMFEIKLRESLAGDWREKGRQIFQSLRECELPLAICFDELPIMVSRMLANPPEEKYEVRRKKTELFLSWLRGEMLKSDEDRLRFTICGSIGLEPVLARHGLTHTINHLQPFHLQTWQKETAETCLMALSAHYEIPLSEKVVERMLDYLAPFIPHHVQMFFGILRQDCKIKGIVEPTEDDVNRVYNEEMLSIRGHAELRTYEERLQRVLGDSPLVDLALTLLTETAVTGELTIDTAKLIAENLQIPDVKEACREVMDILMHDGYLHMSDDQTLWRYKVGLLRDWWKARFGAGYVSVTRERG